MLPVSTVSKHGAKRSDDKRITQVHGILCVFAQTLGFGLFSFLAGSCSCCGSLFACKSGLFSFSLDSLGLCGRLDFLVEEVGVNGLNGGGVDIN
jgi:hypothetical protein